MLLKELISQLVYGELSQLPIGEDNDNGEITEGYQTLIPHINLALSSVHKRLYLREESLTLKLDESITKYHMSTKYAESNTGSNAPIKYIMDTSAPFIGNSLKVEKITNSLGEVMILNDSSVEFPIRTPTPNSIVFTKPVSNVEYTITYRAGHSKFDSDLIDLDTDEVDIPDFVLEPVLYFIASRVHASYPSLEGTNESINYRNKYEAAMAELSEYGLVDTSSNTNQKLETNGWA